MSMIKRSKAREDKPDFDNMMNEVEQELEGLQTEQGIVDRVPELNKLSENIDKATNTWVNATIQLESAIQQYQRAELKLDDAVNSISGKVGTINTHIDNILKEAPTKLQVSVNVSDADWQKIQNKFNQEHKWMLGKMQEHIREVNALLVQERKKVRDRYKEYDGCYLGHYAQWFFLFFFTLGFFVFAAIIVVQIGKWLNWL
ncbi:MAG: hypothetical protein J6W04_04610 [Bacteroidales bacterium]|nr:hypothetical protein [Bacteroidales bacterium]